MYTFFEFFMDLFDVVRIAHVFTVVIGMGAAIVADVLFVRLAQDRKIETAELSALRIAGAVVWVGLLGMIISGSVMVFFIPEYLQSAKLIFKLFLVGILIINGVIFHMYYLPLLQKYQNIKLTVRTHFRKKTILLPFNAAISTCTWLTVFILGSLSTLPFGIGWMISIYIVAVVLVASAIFLTRDRVIKI